MLPLLGSPPRMRGKHGLASAPTAVTGITPADAGKTSCAVHGVVSHGDHPRGCGENAFPSSPTAVTEGSPPRMRGKLPVQSGAKIELRITPADAGKTRYGSRVSCEPWDHPRGCGENSQFPAQISRASGSPPRMRGKHVLHHVLYINFGITPADAGKTLLLPPRAENKGGSPPRMRGKRGWRRF